MKTKAQIMQWLETSNPVRVILIEISGVFDSSGSLLPTFYLSNRPYGSSTTNYTACVVGGLSFTESLDFSGQPNIGYGDIEIENVSGERDNWLQYVWANKPVKIYIGDATWPREDFFNIFTGLVKDIDTKSRTSISLILVNNLQAINEPVSNITITTGANNDQLVPLTFGECFNVTPLLKDSPNLIYQVHPGPIERIIEVRDRGKPVEFEANTENGTFRISNMRPFGAVTCSVQGDKFGGTYKDKIGSIVKSLLMNYGKKLTSTEVNETNLDSVDTNTNLNAGIYLTDRQNVLEVCQQIAFSGGYYLVPDISGVLKLVRLEADPIPGVFDTVYSVTPNDMEFRSLTISQKLEVESAVKIGYSKNWTIQSSDMAGSLKPETLAIMQKSYYYAVAKDLDVKTKYNQLEEPVAKDTFLITQLDAETEAGRLLNIKKSPRFVYTANYFAKMLFCELGDYVNITYPTRFGLESGKTGVAVNITRDWLKGRVTIGVFM